MPGPVGDEDGGDRGTNRPGGLGDRISLPKAIALVVVAVVVGVLALHVATNTGTPASSAAATTTTTAHGTTTTTAHGATTTPAHRTTTTTTAPNPAVTLLVANGTSVPDAATFFSTKLHAAGWNTLPPADTTSAVSTSAVYYAAGQQKPAAALATSLGLKPAAVQALTTAVPVSGTTGADLVLVLGSELANQATTTTTTTT